MPSDYEIMGNIDIGYDQYTPDMSDLSDNYSSGSVGAFFEGEPGYKYIQNKKCTNPYLPIENEPMGRAYNPKNFEGYGCKNVYNYTPLTNETNSRSYLDTWGPIHDKSEHMRANVSVEPQCWCQKINMNFILWFIILILLIVIAQRQSSQFSEIQLLLLKKNQ